jgi:hypothetical protein
MTAILSEEKVVPEEESSEEWNAVQTMSQAKRPKTMRIARIMTGQNQAERGLRGG